jgi:hypothetical protein
VTGAREGRGRCGTWPRWAGVLVAVAGGGAVIAITVMVRAPAGLPHHFPGEYAFSGQYYGYPTTVSAGQAFHDHWLVPPPDIRELQYAADSQGYVPYPYPFAAVFTFPCTEISGFVNASHLQYGGTGPWPDEPSQDDDVLLFAQAQGWHSTDRLARWYYRAVPDAAPEYEELMITGRTVCTAYLSNS